MEAGSRWGLAAATIALLVTGAHVPADHVNHAVPAGNQIQAHAGFLHSCSPAISPKTVKAVCMSLVPLKLLSVQTPVGSMTQHTTANPAAAAVPPPHRPVNSQPPRPDNAAVLGGQAGPQLLGSYGAERRPVALANTRLSVRNWQEATAVPRALGLDPSAASALQALAGSPITAQLPSGAECAGNAAQPAALQRGGTWGRSMEHMVAACKGPGL